MGLVVETAVSIVLNYSKTVCINFFFNVSIEGRVLSYRKKTSHMVINATTVVFAIQRRSITIPPK